MVLLIDACARSRSRTRRLAQELIKMLEEPVREVRLLDADLPPVDEEFLKKRDALIEEGAFDAPMFKLAREFASADRIVVAAPFWDLSFPAVLKQYLEHINVLGVTFVYTKEGIPRGLCRATALYYVTTAGGTFFPTEYGFGYVKALAQSFYGIPEVKLIEAVGLDIDGADEARIMGEALERIGAGEYC